jgi:hypothetical protein
MSKLYTERDIIEQGDYYSRHTSAMTGESLDRKSDIAAELAHRDIQIDQLQARVAELYDLIKYAQVDSGVCMCGDDIKDHNQASGHSSVDVWDHAVEQINKEGSSEAFILRKQAEAVQASREAASVPDMWRDVDYEVPEQAQEVILVLGEKVVHGAWIGGMFWHNNRKVEATKWMPLPCPPK